MAPSPQKRAKAWGYATEMATLRALKVVFPFLRRTGSMAYKRAAADLIQDIYPNGREPIRAVVTRAKRQPLLVTLSMEDFQFLAPAYNGPVVVQVKARATTTIGRIWRELFEATK